MEAIPYRWAESNKTIIKVQLGFINISIERDIMIKYFFLMEHYAW